jgi:ubiquinone/menaquinone biosynthesis C-methylase UbiE
LSERESDYKMKHSEEEAMRLELQASALSEIIDQEFDAMNIKQGMTILDAGCGTGAITRRFAQIAKPATVTAVDFDPVFLETAKAIAIDEGIENVIFESGDIDNLKYQDRAFDFAYCRLVLMHVKNPVKTVEELKRVTRKGGTVAISDQDDGSVIVNPPMLKVMDLWNRYGQWAKTQKMDRFIGRQLYSILSKAGLKSIKIYPFPIHRTQEDAEQLRMFASVPLQVINVKKSELIEQGIFTEEEYDIAVEEFEKLMNEPGAFVMTTFFLAIGEVP